jgi:hypothetical protein
MMKCSQCKRAPRQGEEFILDETGARFCSFGCKSDFWAQAQRGDQEVYRRQVLCMHLDVDQNDVCRTCGEEV